MELYFMLVNPIGSTSSVVKLTGTTLSQLLGLGFRRAGYYSFQQIVQEALLLGDYKEGHYSRVYLIPRVNDYVLKVSKKETVDTSLELVQDPLPARNISQTVAKKGRYKILRRQHGITGGVPFKDYVKVYSNGSDLEDIDKKYKEYIKMVLGMPQKAYEHLAETLVALNDIGYSFDWCHGRNLIFDLDNHEINVVDINKGYIPLTLGHMVPPLLDTIYAYCRRDQLMDQTSNIAQIIEKSTEAALKVGLPILQVLGDTKRFEEHARMEFAFELAGKKINWPQARLKILSPHPPSPEPLVCLRRVSCREPLYTQ